MKKYLVVWLLIMLTLTNYSQTNRFELKVFSSENGYAVVPDLIRITDFNDPGKSVNVQSTEKSFFSVPFSAGTYLLSIGKEGYSTGQTYFSIGGSDIIYAVYLDPVNKDPLFNPDRIRKIQKENQCLLLGYVVDDETGEPLGSVVVKNDKNNITAQSNGNGYFEFYLPANCGIRSFVNLTFNKLGYSAEEYEQFEIFSQTDFIFTVRLKRGNVKLTGFNSKLHDQDCDGCNSKKLITDLPVSGFVLPLNIRVGRNCSGTNCTYAEVYSVETYCKYVLPAEIYACWGNLSGGMNSLQACAVAVRSYGIYYVYNPINPSLYDICDNTYCQYMGSVTSTNTSNAVNNTYRNILTNSAGVVRCEYSAENNNKGCGNGYSGTGSSWPCIYDPVCLNATPNGHGRGLCQWGTVRWATGTLVTISSPCSNGAPHSYGTLTWQQILNHYYNVSPYNWNVVLGITGTINTSSCQPSASNPCSTITISNNVTATNPVGLMAGTSIAPTGTTNWISDPSHDIKINFNQGTGNYNRLFTIPCSAQAGTYDLLTALWYDKDNNNQINSGDFVVHSKLTPAALTLSPIGIKVISSEIPKSYKLYQNYPNPFNPTTQIRFDVPKSSYVELIVFDILGKKVSTLVNKELRPGKYSIDWDASDYPSGVYFYKIQVARFADTKRMIIVK
jgi:hypothetical protein